PDTFLHTLLFSTSIQLPLRSTLFPYTTLFRSLYRPQLPGQSNRAMDASRRRPLGSRLHAGREPLIGMSRRYAAGEPVAERLQSGDRKSTRLNSSHLGISYAVFCLKKKRIEHRE